MKMERYIHITISVCIALVISLAGLIEFEPAICIYHTSIQQTNLIEDKVEQYSIENDIMGNLSSSLRLKNNNSPIRNLTSRTSLRCQNQHRTIKHTTFKLGKALDCRTIIAHCIRKVLLPMATKNKYEFIIRIHKLSIEP